MSSTTKDLSDAGITRIVMQPQCLECQKKQALLDEAQGIIDQCQHRYCDCPMCERIDDWRAKLEKD